VTNQEPAGQPVDVANLMDGTALYHHLVDDHSWENRPYLVNQRLHDLHRLEHTEANLGLVRLMHNHESAAATPVAHPPASDGLGNNLSQVA
jgi:hypothetical protein